MPDSKPEATKLGHPVTRRLGNLLVAEGLITAEQLQSALQEQRASNERLGSILVRLGMLNEDQLAAFLSRQYGVPAMVLSQLEIDPEVLRLVPAQLAKAYEVLPVKLVGGTLTLAMADPTNVFALDVVAFVTNLQVLPVVASQGAIRRNIERLYGARAMDLTDVMAAVDEEATLEKVEGTDEPTVDVFELKDAAEAAPVVKLVNMVLVDAIRRAASDVHFEPYERVFRVRFRIDGVLHEMLTLPKRLEPATISRIKIMARLDIAERRLPQDGHIRLRYQHRDIDLRVSTLPTIFGEKTVIRILDKEALKLDLTQLGFDPWSLEQFEGVIRQPYGMILITGPTGSGKTTTLYSAIHTLNSPDINIMTAEDPVEYKLKGVNQVQVNEEIERTFAALLRAFLRQDPDVILVGEMRDLETAQIAIRAALTGHLVFTTLHTNDCPSSVARLLDMGIPAFLVSSALLLVLAQRLARKVCPECKEAYEVPVESLIPYGYEARNTGSCVLYRGKGCPECNFTGMRGRIAIYEVMPGTQEIRDLILRGAPASEIRAVARQQGMKTLREAGMLKAIEGVTTIEEAIRVTMA